jgi:hypothetical protein
LGSLGLYPIEIAADKQRASANFGRRLSSCFEPAQPRRPPSSPAFACFLGPQVLSPAFHRNSNVAIVARWRLNLYNALEDALRFEGAVQTRI